MTLGAIVLAQQPNPGVFKRLTSGQFNHHSGNLTFILFRVGRDLWRLRRAEERKQKQSEEHSQSLHDLVSMVAGVYNPGRIRENICRLMVGGVPREHRFVPQTCL